MGPIKNLKKYNIKKGLFCQTLFYGGFNFTGFLSFSEPENKIDYKTDKRDRRYDYPKRFLACRIKILHGSICDSPDRQ
jgi:hypothetical protein